MSRNADLIDPTRDRVWAVHVTVAYVEYVVAENAAEAERIAEDESDREAANYYARELTEPLPHSGGIVPYGPSGWEDRELTVNEAVELVASHQPAYDTQTALMPFADSPPPLCPPQIEDYLAAGRCER